MLLSQKYFIIMSTTHFHDWDYNNTIDNRSDKTRNN